MKSFERLIPLSISQTVVVLIDNDAQNLKISPKNEQEKNKPPAFLQLRRLHFKSRLHMQIVACYVFFIRIWWTERGFFNTFNIVPLRYIHPVVSIIDDPVTPNAPFHNILGLNNRLLIK